MKRLSSIILCIAAVVAFSACSNYKLAGTAVELPFSSVYVEPVRNDSYAPQASALLTNAISNAINQVAGLRCAPKGDAQAVLHVKLISYERKPVATSEKDTALAASYAMVGDAECTLERRNGEVIFKNRKVRASVNLYAFDGNVLGNEYQSMPVLMRELGAKIKDAVIGIW